MPQQIQRYSHYRLPILRVHLYDGEWHRLVTAFTDVYFLHLSAMPSCVLPKAKRESAVTP